MRGLSILLLVVVLAGCDLVDPPTSPVDAANLAPLSSREQALIFAADGAAQQGNMAAAERDYLSAVAVSTGHVEAHLALVRLYEKQEQPEKARAILDRALALQPKHPRANYLFGKLALNAAQYDVALDAFEQGLAAQPNQLDLNIGKGVANDMLGQHGAAQLTYQRAMRVNPQADLSSARTNLAMSYLLSNEPKKAVDLLQEDVKKPNASSVTRHNLALAYGVLGRPAEAKKLLHGDIDEETRTLTLARLKEYLGTNAKGGDVALIPAIAHPAAAKVPSAKIAAKPVVDAAKPKPEVKPEKPAAR